MRRLLLALAAATALAGSVAPALAASRTLKIAFVDPLSGGGASTGETSLKLYQYVVDQLNARGGDVRYEVTPYDNKLNPQESIVQLQKAIDAGARIVVQGNGSAVGAALIDFVGKFNDRNPGKEVVYLNHSAVDPSLTNEKCSYWHFRFDAHSDIKMEALTSYMKERPEIKKVYLLNQDYSFGQAVRTSARAQLKTKRPDVQIVGDEVTPLQKVTDFSPYIAKIRASGADTVVTGNWAQDITLLLKAAGDAGLNVNFFTYYGGDIGTPTAIRQANLPDHVFRISEGFPNVPDPGARDFEKAYRAKVGQEVAYPRIANLLNMLARAVDEAKSVDPKDFAPKLEGMRAAMLDGGEGFMRREDHQIFQPMYISVLGPPTAEAPFDSEGTGWAWKLAGAVAPEKTIVPTTCKMDRPS